MTNLFYDPLEDFDIKIGEVGAAENEFAQFDMKELKSLYALFLGIGVSYAGATITPKDVTPELKKWYAVNGKNFKGGKILARMTALSHGVYVAPQDLRIHLAAEGYKIDTEIKKTKSKAIVVKTSATLNLSDADKDVSQMPDELTSVSYDIWPQMDKLADDAVCKREEKRYLEKVNNFLDVLMCYGSWSGDAFVCSLASDHAADLRLSLAIKVDKIESFFDRMTQIFSKMGNVELGTRDSIDCIMNQLKASKPDRVAKFVTMMVDYLPQIYPTYKMKTKEGMKTMTNVCWDDTKGLIPSSHVIMHQKHDLKHMLAVQSRSNKILGSKTYHYTSGIIDGVWLKKNRARSREAGVILESLKEVYDKHVVEVTKVIENDLLSKTPEEVAIWRETNGNIEDWVQNYREDTCPCFLAKDTDVLNRARRLGGFSCIELRENRRCSYNKSDLRVYYSKPLSFTSKRKMEADADYEATILKELLEFGEDDVIKILPLGPTFWYSDFEKRAVMKDMRFGFIAGYDPTLMNWLVIGHKDIPFWACLNDELDDPGDVRDSILTALFRKMQYARHRMPLKASEFDYSWFSDVQASMADGFSWDVVSYKVGDGEEDDLEPIEYDDEVEEEAPKKQVRSAVSSIMDGGNVGELDGAELEIYEDEDEDPLSNIDETPPQKHIQKQPTKASAPVVKTSATPVRAAAPPVVKQDIVKPDPIRKEPKEMPNPDRHVKKSASPPKRGRSQEYVQKKPDVNAAFKRKEN